jgi:hypothetical protein
VNRIAQRANSRTARNKASVPYRRKDVAAAIRGGWRFQRLQTKRALYATAAFLLSCACVALFLQGSPLHGYWESFGKYLVLLSMGLLIPCVIFVGIAIQVWFNVRSMEKD